MFGLFLFFKHCHKDFDLATFWRPTSGKKLVQSCWRDSTKWILAAKTKDDDFWGYIIGLHPTYLPTEELSDWLCVNLIEKYEDRSAARPEWMRGDGEFKFIKRILTVYNWKGVDEGEAERGELGIC